MSLDYRHPTSLGLHTPCMEPARENSWEAGRGSSFFKNKKKSKQKNKKTTSEPELPSSSCRSPYWLLLESSVMSRHFSVSEQTSLLNSWLTPLPIPHPTLLMMKVIDILPDLYYLELTFIFSSTFLKLSNPLALKTPMSADSFFFFFPPQLVPSPSTFWVSPHFPIKRTT